VGVSIFCCCLYCFCFLFCFLFLVSVVLCAVCAVPSSLFSQAVTRVLRACAACRVRMLCACVVCVRACLVPTPNPITNQIKDQATLRTGPGGSKWVVECSPVVVGTYRLAVTLRGTPLAGSPFTLAVEPGAPDPLLSTTSPVPPVVAAGEPDPAPDASDADSAEWVVWMRGPIAERRVRVQLRDAWGNDCARVQEEEHNVAAVLQRVRDGAITKAPGVVEVRHVDRSCVWFGLVWFVLVWVGLVWFGLVWFGFSVSALSFVCVVWACRCVGM